MRLEVEFVYLETYVEEKKNIHLISTLAILKVTV